MLPPQNNALTWSLFKFVGGDGRQGHFCFITIYRVSAAPGVLSLFQRITNGREGFLNAWWRCPTVLMEVFSVFCGYTM